MKSVISLIVVPLLFAGCATFLSGGIPSYLGPGQSESLLDRDARACEKTATGEANALNRRTYMACMIARGYRTYITVGRHGAAAGVIQLTVLEQNGQPQEQVLRDFADCGQKSDGAQVGESALMSGLFGGSSGLVTGPLIAAGLEPFAACLRDRGYVVAKWEP